MADVLSVCGFVAFFAAMVLLIKGCEKIVGSDEIDLAGEEPEAGALAAPIGRSAT